MEKFYATQKLKTVFWAFIDIDLKGVSRKKNIFFVLLMLTASFVRAQAPTISYASPQVYRQSVTITPLAPTANGVGTQIFGSRVAIRAGLNHPISIVVDAAHNVYVADYLNSNIKEFPADGSTFVVIGTGFKHPLGLAINAAGDLFVTDQGNNVVKKIPAGGGAPVIIGTGFNNPYGVAVDASGNVYVSDNYNEVKKIPVDGGAPVIFASGFNDPQGLAVDAAGNVYVADWSNGAVKKIPAGGGTPVIFRSGFGAPQGVAVDAAGNVFVADGLNNEIAKVPANGGPTVNFGSAVVTQEPLAVAVDAQGNVYESDRDNTLTKISADGKTSTNLNPGITRPVALVFDRHDNLFVANNFYVPLIEIPAGHGQIINKNTGGTISARVMALDNAGNIYVINSNYTLLKKIPADGGAPIELASGYAIVAVAVDASGNVYYSNGSKRFVKEIPANGGPVITLASSLQDPPNGINIDSSGNIWILETGNGAISRIIKIPPGGGPPVTVLNGTNIYNTFLDASNNLYYTDLTSIKKLSAGTSTPATIAPVFSGMGGIALDTFGNIYVADNIGDKIDEIKRIGGYDIAPALPAGLVFDSTTGIISGTPTQISAATDYKITAYNNTGKTSAIVTIKVNAAPPTIIPGTVSGNISACVGDASVSPNIQQFTVSGSNLTGNIIATAPTNFQVSLSPGSGYAHAVTLLQTGGVISNEVVYVRSAATAPMGGISGNVVLTSAGATSLNEAVNGTVNALSVINPVPNQTVFNGAKTAAVNFSGTATVFNWTNDKPGIGLAASGSGNIAPFTAVNAGITPITATVTVTNPPGFGNRGYITNQTDKSVSVIDLETNTVIATIPVGAYTYELVISPNGRWVYVAKQDGTLSVIDASTNTVVSTVTIGTFAYGLCISPDGSKLYIANEFLNVIKILDTSTNTIIGTINPGTLPGGLAISPDGSHLYACVSNNGMAVINTATNSVIKTIPTGQSPNGIEVSPDGSRIYVENTNSGDITVIDGIQNSRLATITIGGNPGIFAISPDGSRLYIDSDGEKAISVVNTATNTVISTFSVPPPSTGLSVSADGSKLYIENLNLNAVLVINTATNATLATIPVGKGPISTSPVNFLSYRSTCPGAPVKFTITVNPVISTLSNLKLSAGTLSPAFSKDSTTYLVTEPAGQNSITVTPTATDARATITVNGVSVISGHPSASIPLSAGLNTINVVVTAEDGITTKTYTIKVGKGSANDNLAALRLSAGTLSPVFATATNNYTATVNSTTSSITVTARTATATSTITVNGNPVTSGTASAPIPLNLGTNTINVTVTAQDGISKQTYTITVTRPASTNANLASLKFTPGVLTPVFTAANTSYTIHVVNGVDAVTVTPTVADATAEVTVIGTAQASGTATNPIHINVGINTFTIQVTAQDLTTTKTYTVVVTRAASSNDNLAGLSLSAGTLSPAFAPATTGYTAKINNGVDSVRVKPTLADETATVTVNGVTTPSGQLSNKFAVNVGDNIFHVTVTAQDGVTSQTYTVTITKLPEFSHNAYLSYLQLNRNVDIPISPAFGYLTNNYTATVSNSTDSIKVTEVTADGGATATINGIPATQRTPTDPISLNVGPNTITTIVTAFDGITTDTYTIVVTREAAAGEQSLSAADGIIVHQGLSPNGDGVNDVLNIDGIKQYPDNKLTIINTNGNLIFEAQGYDNSNKVFDGHDSKTGKMQLPGTYYYSLEYTVNGVIKHRTGYIVMKY